MIIPRRAYWLLKTTEKLATERYIALYRKFLEDRHTPEDLDALLAHFQAADGPEDLRALIRQELDHAAFTEAEHGRIDALVDRVHGRIFRKRPSAAQRFARWLPYAAAAAILLAVGWLLLVDSRQSTVDRLAATDILPGGNRATLTLADGRVIDLDEAQTGIVVGAKDITYDDGSVVSPADSPHAGLTTYDLQLTTPKGGQYQVTLPDGSKVWLNSASTLKYPSRFSGDSREVILEGEAFFDIQEIQGTRVSRVPFKVLTSGQTVEVLGTAFNISAYADDPETKTTLVEGKVRVRVERVEPVPTSREARFTAPDNSDVTLSPGEQSTTTESAITVNPVDTEPYTAWKSGLFMFDREPLERILRKVSRWYDVDIRYERDDLRNQLFSGTVSRFENASQVLDILALTELASFRVEGKTIIVSAPNAGTANNTKN